MLPVKNVVRKELTNSMLHVVGPLQYVCLSRAKPYINDTVWLYIYLNSST